MLYMTIAAILLVNMLIAMMGNTYQVIAERKNEWMRQVFFLVFYRVLSGIKIPTFHWSTISNTWLYLSYNIDHLSNYVFNLLSSGLLLSVSPQKEANQILMYLLLLKYKL